MSLSFSSDGALLASGGGDNTIKLWDVDAQQEIAALRGHTDSVRSVAFSPDGALLASGSFDHTILLWDVAGSTRVPDRIVALQASAMPRLQQPLVFQGNIESVDPQKAGLAVYDGVSLRS